MPGQDASPRRQVRFFVAYCIGLILGYTLYMPGKTAPGFPTGGPGDFIIYYTGAHIIRNGEGARLYDLNLQSHVQQAFLTQHGWNYEGGLLPYVNPPFFATVLVPLSYLPLAWAYHLWNLLNILLILFCIRLLAQATTWSRAFLLRIVVVFSFFPVFEALWQGQSSFVILLALTLCHRAMNKRAESEAGMLLALGFVKPQLLGVPAVMLLYLRRWRVLTAVLLSGLVLALLPCVFIGVDVLVSYLRLSSELLGWVGVGGMHPRLMPNLRGTVFRLAGWLGIPDGRETLVPWMNVAVLASGVAVLVWSMRVWRKWTGSGPAEWDLLFAHMVACALFLSPHLYGHDLSLLVLAGFLVGRCLEHRAEIARRNLILCLGHTGFTLPYLLGLPLEVRAQMVAVLLFALMVVLSREIDRHLRSAAANT